MEGSETCALDCWAYLWTQRACGSGLEENFRRTSGSKSILLIPTVPDSVVNLQNSSTNQINNALG